MRQQIINTQQYLLRFSTDSILGAEYLNDTILQAENKLNAMTNYKLDLCYWEQDNTSDNYRTDAQRQAMETAIIETTKWLLNKNNNLTIGSESTSTGGEQKSNNRPMGSDIIFEDVIELLIYANIYNENIIETPINDNSENNVNDSPYITLEQAKQLFIPKIQDMGWKDKYVEYEQNGDITQAVGKTIQEIWTIPNYNYIDTINIVNSIENSDISLSCRHIQLDNGNETITRTPLPIATTNRNGLMSATDKVKLNNLNEHFVGHYATLQALTQAIPQGKDGDYAYIEGGINLQIAYWDNVWTLSGSTSGITSLGIGDDINDTTNSKSLEITNTDPNNIVLAFNKANLPKLYRHDIYLSYHEQGEDIINTATLSFQIISSDTNSYDLNTIKTKLSYGTSGYRLNANGMVTHITPQEDDTYVVNGISYNINNDNVFHIYGICIWVHDGTRTVVYFAEAQETFSNSSDLSIHDTITPL